MARIISIIICILFLLFLFVFPPIYFGGAQKTLNRELEAAHAAAIDEDWPAAAAAYGQLSNEFNKHEKVFKLFFDHEDIDSALEAVNRAGVALTLREKLEFVEELSTFSLIITYVTDIERLSLHDIF